MNAKREMAPMPDTSSITPDFLTNMAAKTQGNLEQPRQPERTEPRTEVEPYGHPIQPMFREKQAFQKMSVNVPKELYEELRAYMKLTDISMSDVAVEGIRRELKRRKRESE